MTHPLQPYTADLLIYLLEQPSSVVTTTLRELGRIIEQHPYAVQQAINRLYHEGMITNIEMQWENGLHKLKPGHPDSRVIRSINPNIVYQLTIKKV